MTLYEIWQSALAGAVTVMLALMALAVGVAIAAVYLAPIVRWIRRHKGEALLVAPFVVCLVYVGSTKYGRVDYPYTDIEVRYLIDAGSYVTNDYVHVAFTRSAVVPESAEFLGFYRPMDSTNDADWVQFVDTTFAQFRPPVDIPFPGAITNDFQFFTTYTPGPVVHTNGVAVVNWQQNFERDGRYLATIRTGIYTNAFRIAPNPGITNGPTFRVFITAPTGSNNDE